MTLLDMPQIEAAWPALSPFLTVPHDDASYERLVAVLDTLIDVVGEDETHPLASLMDVMGVLIEQYETAHVPELDDE